MKITTPIAVSVVAVATFLSTWVYFGTASLTAQVEDRTERMTACVESGGTWMNKGDCIK